jgi:glycosyltransferase involved in cell wall biosynthesis
MHFGASVIIPVRNGAAYISEAMTLALAQLNQEDELIVVDDGSTDDTLGRVAALADSRIRVLSAPRRGVSAARNVGFDASRGQFIAFLDHDDVWCPCRHRVMLGMLLENPDLDAVFGRIRVRFEPDATASPRYAALDGQFAAGASVGSGLFRRGILERVSGFAEDMTSGEDTDHHMRMMESGMRFRLCDIDCLIYRRHASNVTNDATAMRDGYFNIFRRKLARGRRSV